MNIATARTQLINILQLQDVSLDTATDTLNQALTDAVDQYSQDRPLEQVTLRTGDGTKSYPLPSDFTFDFSVMLAVEYPIDENPVSWVMEKNWDTVKRDSASSDVLLFITSAPSSSQQFRMYYTKYTQSFEDVRTQDARAVLNLAASFACLHESGKASQTADDNTNLDFTDRRSPAREFKDMAKEFEKKYRLRMFGDTEAIEPQARITDLDTEFNRKHRRILHKRQDT